MNQLIKTSKFLKRFPLSRNFSCSFFALERKYTEDHEWVELTGNICKFGITDYAQKALGDVVYIEVPSVGDQVAQKDEIGSVESVKASSDIYSPISGKVVEINSSLEEKPSLINSNPYDEGWIAKIEIKDPSELDSLMDEAAYEKFTE